MSVQDLIKTPAKKHPVFTFLLITFAWTWLLWLAAIPFRGQTLLVTALVMIGGFGPALGGILTLALQSGAKPDLSVKRVLVWALSATFIFGLMALRYWVGNVPNYETLAADLTLSAPVVLAALAASLVGGWVISSAVSANTMIRARMASMLPWRQPTNWTLFGLVFYPVLIFTAWGLAALVGLEVEFPGLWGRPALDALPLYLLTFGLVAVAQGGNEEPGWRGFLQPELQKRFSPLVAALLVSGAWSLWHLPLYLNGFYGENLVGGMLGGGIFRILLAIFLAWFYHHSDGNLFMMIFLHTNFNVMVNFLPTSDLMLLVLWLVVVLVVVFKDKMFRKSVEGKSEEHKEVSRAQVFQ